MFLSRSDIDIQLIFSYQQFKFTRFLEYQKPSTVFVSLDSEEKFFLLFQTTFWLLLVGVRNN